MSAERSRRLRVAGPHVYRLRTGSDIGGEVYERMLLERLPAHGIDLILAVRRDHTAGDLPAEVTLEVRRRAGVPHWVLAPLVFTPVVVRWLRRGRVDVLRGHSVRHTAPSLLLGRALARSRVPIVVHHHHFTARWARLEAAILRRADAVITVSEHSRAALLAAGVAADRIHVVADGVARPAPTEGWAEAWPADGLRLIHLGRLEPRKHPEVAIDALARLRGHGVAAALVLAGEGPMRAALERRAREAGVGSRVAFLGRVSEADKWRLLDAADLLLFASRLEGFGIVVAEAQSRGVPVIAAAGTATAEALAPGESGLLVAPEAEAFASAVRALEDPARRREMSERAREVAAHFDWDASAAQVAAILRALEVTR